MSKYLIELLVALACVAADASSQQERFLNYSIVGTASVNFWPAG